MPGGGGQLKVGGGGYMNFHVASRGVTFNLGFLAGEGVMFKLSLTFLKSKFI